MNFLSSTSVGLDISDHTVEVVALKKQGGAAHVVASAAVQLESGIVEKGSILQPDVLADVLTKAFENAQGGPIEKDNIIFGLPETLLYTHAFFIPKLSPKDITDALPKMIEKTVPLPYDDVIFSHTIAKRTSEGVHVVVAVASRAAVASWEAFFRKNGFDIEAFDVESFAVFRDLYKTPPKEPVCVIDIGSATTSICFFGPTGLRASHTYHVAGDVFSEALVEADRATDLLEANSLKQTLSVEDPALLPAVQMLEAHIKRQVQAFEERTEEQVAELVFVGGGSVLQGLVAHLGEHIGKPARLGASVLIPPEEVGFRFLEAVGLAYRGLDEKWTAKDPAIALFDKKQMKQSMVRPTKNVSQKKSPKLSNALNSMDVVKKKVFVLGGVLLVGALLLFWANGVAEKRESEKKEEIQRIQDTLQDIPATPVAPVVPPEEEDPLLQLGIVTTTDGTFSTNTDLLLLTTTSPLTAPESPLEAPEPVLPTDIPSPL